MIIYTHWGMRRKLEVSIMKKLFSKANMSFMMALQLFVLPMVICLIIASILLGYEMDVTYNNAESLYYETLYQINTKLVNGDRDFYQAMVAAQQYISVSQSDGNLPPEVMDALYAARLATYEENLDYLKQWLANRYIWMSEFIAAVPLCIQTSSIPCFSLN